MRRLIAVAAAVALSGSIVAQGKRPITETDLLKFTWIADPQISPDGSAVAFTRVVVNEKTDDYETSLWLVAANGSGEPRPLTAGPHDSTPRWSPDGRRLAFVRAAERDGKTEPPQIYLLPFDGGEARGITDLPKGASAPAWSPDGTRIAFSSTTRDEDFATPAEGAKPSDVRVITEAVYRFNGSGWSQPDRPAHVWVTTVGAGVDIAKPRQLTSGKYADSGHVWAPDGSRIYFTSNQVDEPYYQQSDSDLYAVPAGGGPAVKVASISGTISSPRPSPDGKSIAFEGTLNGAPQRSYDQPDLFVAPADGSSAPRNLTAGYDFDIGGSVGGDQRAPRGGGSGGPIWSADGRSIVMVAGERGDANLLRFDVATGKPEPVLKGSHTVQSYSASANGRTLAAVVSTPTNINDIVIVDAAAGSAGARPITHVNDALFQTLSISTPEAISWTSFDGREIQGWLLHPPDFDRSKRYPFILGLRQRLHARVPLDGGEGLRGAVPEPARQQQLRPGVRQRHPVPLPRRRLQGPDGRRGRGDEARLHRREADGRHRRQRRRPADQLDDHPDSALRGSSVDAVDRGLVRLLVHGRLRAVHAVVVPQGAVGGPAGLRRALPYHPRRQGDDAADVD
jgi:dipeptidyl aminopeptidase/acylaminoacyl peptidase